MTIRLIAFTSVAALALGIEPLARAAVQPAFSARVEGVRVDALVTDNDRPILGLRAADFELRDNGVLQSIELVTLDTLPLNLVLAFDLSQSVEGERVERLRRAGHALLDGVKTDDRTGLVTFSETVTLKCALSTDARCLRDALATVKPGGQTSLIDGTYAAMIVGESEPGRSLVMVFSDRFDTSSWLSASRVVETAKRTDVVVYGVMASPGQSRFLRDLSETTGGRMLRGDGDEDLAAVFVKILDEFRQRYVLTYSPRGVSEPGWHALSVRVKRRGAVVRVRPGYQVDPR
jgi:VWFA-related protein